MHGSSALGAFLIALVLIVIPPLVSAAATTPAPPVRPSPVATPLAGESFSFGVAGNLEGPGNVDMVALSKRLAAASTTFLIALGDLGYTTDEAGWCTSIKSGISDVELIAGNHDVGEDPGGNMSEHVVYCPFTLNVPVVAGPNTPGYGYEYYFDYPATSPLARFILIAAGVRGSLDYDFSPGSSHWNFVVDSVNSARAGGIPWVIVGQHKPCIILGPFGCDMTQVLFDELVKLKVDLILHAHHSYQRSKQLALGLSCSTVPAGVFDADCIVDDGADGLYGKGAGPVVVNSGAGGARLYDVPLDGSDAEIGYFVQAMGNLSNTKGLQPGFGATVFTVSSDHIEARTDFCPSGATGETGECPGTSGSTFQDSFAVTTSSDFTVSVFPTSSLMRRNHAATATVSIIGSSTDAVALSVSSCPADTVCTFSPASGSPGFTSSFQISTGPTAPLGSVDLVIAATNASVTRTVTLHLTISELFTQTFQRADGGAFSETDDASIYNDAPNNNFGADPKLSVDATGCKIATDTVCRTLLKFPDFIGPNLGQVPQGSTIVSANLQLTVSDAGGTQLLFQMTEAWTESGVTWNAFAVPGSPATKGSGIAFAAPAGVVAVNIATVVQNWVNGEANLGMLIRSDSAEGVDYRSSESTSPPKLTVTFRLPSPPPGPSPLVLGVFLSIGLLVAPAVAVTGVLLIRRRPGSGTNRAANKRP